MGANIKIITPCLRVLSPGGSAFFCETKVHLCAMYYKVTGKGKVVVLLHGFIEEGSLWNNLAKALAKDFKVIVPDLEGFGQSPLIATKLTMEYYATAIYKLLQKLKVKRCVMLGHSMGGYITLSFAQQYPQLLSGFGVVNSHCFADNEEKKVNRKKGIEFIRRHGTAPFVTELYNNIFHPSFKVKNQALINRLIEQAKKYSPEALMAANAAMMNRTGKEDVLKNAPVPVLLINGKQDESAPFAATIRQASFPPIADVHFYDNCKHMSLFEKKKETNAAIYRFVTTCYR